MSLAVRWDVWWPVGAAVALVGESGCGRATPTRPEQPVSSGRSVNLGRHDIGSGCRRARSWAGVVRAVAAGSVGNLAKWYEFGVYGVLATVPPERFFAPAGGGRC